MNHDKINKTLEVICNRGCSVVNDIIESMEQGQRPDETRELSSQEQMALLDELKKIMAVYERKNT